MTILFNNGPMAGRFATVSSEKDEIRVRYLKDGKSVTAKYVIGEKMRHATRKVFAAASYVGDIESADSLVDVWAYRRSADGRDPSYRQGQ